MGNPFDLTQAEAVFYLMHSFCPEIPCRLVIYTTAQESAAIKIAEEWIEERIGV